MIRKLKLDLTKEQLENLITQKISATGIAKLYNVDYRSVLSQFKKYNLKNYYSKQLYHKCKTCNEENPINFRGNSKSRCKKCENNHSGKLYDKLKENKKKFTDYKGGKCQICQYNKYYGALEFHHLNPKEKDVNWKTIKGWNFERAKKELDKCLLLCSNCHREVHGGLHDEFISNYYNAL